MVFQFYFETSRFFVVVFNHLSVRTAHGAFENKYHISCSGSSHAVRQSNGHSIAAAHTHTHTPMRVGVDCGIKQRIKGEMYFSSVSILLFALVEEKPSIHNFVNISKGNTVQCEIGICTFITHCTWNVNTFKCHRWIYEFGPEIIARVRCVVFIAHIRPQLELPWPAQFTATRRYKRHPPNRGASTHRYRTRTIYNKTRTKPYLLLSLSTVKHLCNSHLLTPAQ